jgi:hypothetical protein
LPAGRRAPRLTPRITGTGDQGTGHFLKDSRVVRR